MMLGPNQTRWLEALESGDYPQGNTYLNYAGKFCCLGVASELFKTDSTEVLVCNPNPVAYDGQIVIAPSYVVVALGLFSRIGKTSDLYTSLAELNDNDVSFERIAYAIRRDPSNFFKEPK